MNFALFGYGKMGKAIEKVAIDRGHVVVLRVDQGSELNKQILKDLHIDVALEFSSPGSAYKNLKFCLENDIPVLSGSTGWLDKKEVIEKLTMELNGSFFYTSNFSLGVNLFFKLNQHLAKLIAGSPYRPRLEEIHHTEKKDSPSGTAITLAEDIIKENKGLKNWSEGEPNHPEDLSIISYREEDVPGTHCIIYEGLNDDIKIEHVAKNRDGFALGAVVVAEWLVGKKGVLGMGDFMEQ